MACNVTKFIETGVKHDMQRQGYCSSETQVARP